MHYQPFLPWNVHIDISPDMTPELIKIIGNFSDEIKRSIGNDTLFTRAYKKREITKTNKDIRKKTKREIADVLRKASIFHEIQTYYTTIITKDLANPYTIRTIQKEQEKQESRWQKLDPRSYNKTIAPHNTLFGAFLYHKLKNICTNNIESIYASDAMINIVGVALSDTCQEKDSACILLYITTHYDLFEAALRAGTPSTIQLLPHNRQRKIEQYIPSYYINAWRNYQRGLPSILTKTVTPHYNRKRKESSRPGTSKPAIINTEKTQKPNTSSSNEGKNTLKHNTPTSDEGQKTDKRQTNKESKTQTATELLQESFTRTRKSHYRSQVPQEWTDEDMFLYLIDCTNLQETEKQQLYTARQQQLPHLQTPEDREKYIAELDARMFMVERTNNPLRMTINDLKTAMRNHWGSKSGLRFGEAEPIKKKRAK